MIEEIPEWEKKIDESREKHKHVSSKGGLLDGDTENIKYCYDCDMFYEDKNLNTNL